MKRTLTDLPEPIECCGKIFTTKVHYASHRARVHGELSQVRSSVLRRERAKMLKMRCPFEQCGKVLHSPGFRERHIRQVHGGMPGNGGHLVKKAKRTYTRRHPVEAVMTDSNLPLNPQHPSAVDEALSQIAVVVFKQGNLEIMGHLVKVQQFCSTTPELRKAVK